MGRHGEWAVRCVWLGEAERAPSRLVGPSTVWESVTPYLPPWHIHRGIVPAEQIRREINQQACPRRGAWDRFQLWSGAMARFVRLRTSSSGSTGEPRGPDRPEAAAGFWRLTFPEPVAGPLAVGWGCHFGLGPVPPRPS